MIEINDGFLVIRGQPKIDRFYDSAAIVARNSQIWPQGERARQSQISERVYNMFSRKYHRAPTPTFRPYVDETIIMDLTRRPYPKDGFKPIYSWWQNTPLVEYIKKQAQCATMKMATQNRPQQVLMIVRRMDGLLTDLSKLDELRQYVRSKNIVISICFYLDINRGFTGCYTLDEILFGNGPDVIYMRRRLRSLAAARQPPEDRLPETVRMWLSACSEHRQGDEMETGDC